MTNLISKPEPNREFVEWAQITIFEAKPKTFKKLYQLDQHGY